MKEAGTGMVRYDIKRAFNVKWITVSILIFICLMIFSEFDMIVEVYRSGESLETGWTNIFLTNILAGDSMIFVLPILCTLPYSSGFIDDYQSGIIKFVLGRERRWRYLISKIVAAAFSGGIVILSGLLFMVLLAIIIFVPMEGMNPGKREVSETLLMIIKLLCRYFCFGMLGGEVGLYVSTKSNCRFMAWFSSFIAEYLLIILVERYCPALYIIYPKEWLMPSQKWPLDSWSVCFWLLLMAFSVSGSFFKAAMRRLEDV